jgi:hypothetical protein
MAPEATRIGRLLVLCIHVLSGHLVLYMAPEATGFGTRRFLVLCNTLSGHLVLYMAPEASRIGRLLVLCIHILSGHLVLYMATGFGRFLVLCNTLIVWPPGGTRSNKIWKISGALQYTVCGVVWHQKQQDLENFWCSAIHCLATRCMAPEATQFGRQTGALQYTVWSSRSKGKF